MPASSFISSWTLSFARGGFPLSYGHTLRQACPKTSPFLLGFRRGFTNFLMLLQITDENPVEEVALTHSLQSL
eukprot:2598528-Amphidinium_carterae.1